MGQDDDDGVVNDMKTSVSVINDVLRLAGENADTRAAGAELGKTALTITKTINNALLPLAAVNFAFDKARDYFAIWFPQDIAEKVANIPADSVTAPKPSVAGPALQVPVVFIKNNR